MPVVGADLSKRLVHDELWELAAPLVQSFAAGPQGGGPLRVTSAPCFTAAVYALTNGCAWRHLPPTFGTSPAIAHRPFTVWTEAGLWRRLHRAGPASRVWPPRRGVRRSGRRTPNRPLLRWLCGEDRCSSRVPVEVQAAVAREGKQLAQTRLCKRGFDHLGIPVAGFGVALQQHAPGASMLPDGIAPVLARGHPVRKRDSAIRTLAPYPHVQAGVES